MPQSSAPPNKTNENFTSLVKQAEQEEPRGLEFAIRAWSQVANEFPERPAGHVRLGWCHIRSNDFTAAHKCFEKALSINSIQVGALRGLAAVKIKQGDYPAAVTHLDAIPDTASEAEKLHVFQMRLTCLTELGHREKTLATIRTHLDENPDKDRFLQEGIDTARKLGYFAEAREIAQQALIRNPNNTSLRLNSAQENIDNGHFDAAHALLLETSPADRENAPIKIALCRSLVGMDRFDEARVILHQILKTDPQSEPACQLLSRVESITSKPDQALEVFDKLGMDWKSRPELARIYLTTLANAGRIKIECFQDPQIIKMAETHVDLGQMVVMYLLAPFREFEIADRLSKKIHENFPNKINAMKTRAMMLNAAGRFDEASKIDLRPVLRTQNHPTLRQIVEQARIGEKKDLQQSYQAYLPVAWDLANQSKQSHQEWLEQAIESTNRANLFFKVLQCDPNSADTAYGLLNDAQRDKVRAYFPDGKPAIIAGFHDNFPTPVALKRIIPSYHYISHWQSCDNGDLNGYDRIIDGFEANTLIKDIKAALKANNVVGIAIDMSMRASSPTAKVKDRHAINVGGRKISFRTPHAHLVRQTGLPCYAVKTSFRAGKILIDIFDMPKPIAGEPLSVWNERWQRGVEKALQMYVSSDPDLLNLASPIWRSLANTEPSQRAN